MNIRDLFRRKKKQVGAEPRPLRIEGVTPAPLTAEPDDAELAAQALLETMRSEECRVKSEESATAKSNHTVQSSKLKAQSETHDAEYYRKLADRIRQAHEESRLRALRFVAFCEQQLSSGKELPLTGDGSLGLLEAELYKRIDIVEREGGELLRRWQHCLAEVIVRLMQAGSQGDDTPNPVDDNEG